jgi:pimeloyl-ACP methyl ester carboxylesterase
LAQRLLVQEGLMAGLSFTIVGSGRPRFAFLHGLFGRGRNWTQIAQGLAVQGHTSVLFDLPNHGASAWTETVSYAQMAGAVTREIERRIGDVPLVLVGHSMGGKVAMLTALTHPTLLAGLAVVDISPTDSAQVSSFGPYLDAMRSINLAHLTSKAEAEHLLSASVPSLAVRKFLLTNLRERSGWHWQPNLDLLAESLPELAGWPEVGAVTFEGPTSWLVGERSAYYRAADFSLMQRYFPAVHQVMIAGAGHWVHADNPSAVITALAELSAASPS